MASLRMIAVTRPQLISKISTHPLGSFRLVANAPRSSLSIVRLHRCRHLTTNATANSAVKPTKGQLAKGIVVAVIAQTAIGTVLMKVDNMLYTYFRDTFGEDAAVVSMNTLPIVFMASSLGAGTLLFRRLIAPAQASWLWYLLALPMTQLLSLPVSALINSQLNDIPPLSPEDLEDVRKVAVAHDVQAFTPITPLEQAVQGWAMIFKELSNGEESLTKSSVCNSELSESLILRAAGLHRFVQFLQSDPRLLNAMLGIVTGREKDGISIKDFMLVMVAMQAAVEKGSNPQKELLFRFLKDGQKGVSRQELDWWLSKLMQIEASNTSLELDSLVGSGRRARRLTASQLMEKYMKQFDKDRDGYLSLQEFAHLCDESPIVWASVLFGASLVQEVPIQQSLNVLQFVVLNPSITLKKSQQPKK